MKLLTNNLISNKYLLVLILLIITFIIRFLVISSGGFIFVTIILISATLFLIHPRAFFIIALGIAILFYTPFLQQLLFTVGNTNVYSQDLLYASLIFYILMQISFKNRLKLYGLKSTKVFILLFFWGVIEIARGYPRFGFSAIGESRNYVLILFNYFFVLFAFYKTKHIINFLKWIAFFIIATIILHFIQFFLLGGNYGLVGRDAFRFIYGVETFLSSLILAFLFLFYINNRLSISVLWAYLSFLLLSATIIIVQTRSAWLAVAVGLFSAYGLSKKKSIFKGILALFIGFSVLITFLPLIGQYVGISANLSLSRSAGFLQNPEEDATGSWRLMGWQQELNKALKNPILGGGIGGYSLWFDGKYWQRVTVHNGYIMLFSKLGLIGIILFILGVIYWFRELNYYVKYVSNLTLKLIAKFFIISIIMHLVYSMFFGFSMFFWILIGLGSSLVIQSGKFKNSLYELR